MAGKMYAQLSLPLVMVLLVLVSICHCAPDPEARKKQEASAITRAYNDVVPKLFKCRTMDAEYIRDFIDTKISEIKEHKKNYGSYLDLDKLLGTLQELADVCDPGAMDCTTVYERIQFHHKDKPYVRSYLEGCIAKQADRCPPENFDFTGLF